MLSHIPASSPFLVLPTAVWIRFSLLHRVYKAMHELMLSCPHCLISCYFILELHVLATFHNLPFPEYSGRSPKFCICSFFALATFFTTGPQIHLPFLILFSLVKKPHLLCTEHFIPGPPNAPIALGCLPNHSSHCSVTDYLPHQIRSSLRTGTVSCWLFYPQGFLQV